MEYSEKIVDFRLCKKCKNWKTPEEDEPCYTCLDNPTNTYSRKPIKFSSAKEETDNG